MTNRLANICRPGRRLGMFLCLDKRLFSTAQVSKLTCTKFILLILNYSERPYCMIFTSLMALAWYHLLVGWCQCNTTMLALRSHTCTAAVMLHCLMCHTCFRYGQGLILLFLQHHTNVNYLKDKSRRCKSYWSHKSCLCGWCWCLKRTAQCLHIDD